MEEGGVAVPVHGPAHQHKLQDQPDNLQPPLRNAPLPPVACLQHEVSWQTEHFCSEQSLSSYVHLVYDARTVRGCQLSSAAALFISLSLLCMV